MRLGFFLLVVVFTIADNCYEVVNANGVVVKTNVDLKNPTLRRLDDAAVPTDDAEDEERELGFTRLINKLPGIDRLKTLLGRNPSVQKVEAVVAKTPELAKIKSSVGSTPIKVNTADVKKLETAVKKKEVHPAINVMKSVLKMLVVVGAISFTVGAIVYIKENYF